MEIEFKSHKNICVFTGSRSEYGLMRHLIKAIREEDRLNLQLVVAGSHLSNLHGRTIKEIRDDGIEVSSIVPISIDSEIPKTMGELGAEAMKGMSEELKRLEADIVIVLGDRYETFAAAAAAFLSKIPIVHLHGGETTLGAIDNDLRHAITQLSSWHFTAAEEYRQRVIKSGKPEDKVFNIGPMVADALAVKVDTCRKDFEDFTGYRFGARNALVTFHPETLALDSGMSCFKELLYALRHSCFRVLFTHPNADEGYRDIVEEMRRFVELDRERFYCVSSLGQSRYLEALHVFDVMIGNSSSGIIEGPLVGIPVINIGNRQKGRLRYGPVQDIECSSGKILSALEGIRSRSEGDESACSSRPWRRPTDQIMRFLLTNI